MPTFEVEFKTAIPNREDKSGHWFNYYEADSDSEAIEKLHEEVSKFHICVKKVIAVKEV